ncbi:MAG: hypothetical protein ACFFAN_08720 [Promethearchaeota archaeon]
MNNGREFSFFCKECGWKFPEELIEILKKKEESVYCERCGAESNRGILYAPHETEQIHQKKAISLWNVLLTAKKKSLKYKKKLKSKLRELSEKLENE